MAMETLDDKKPEEKEVKDKENEEGSKEEVTAKFLKFLESPHATTDVLLADKEQVIKVKYACPEMLLRQTSNLGGSGTSNRYFEGEFGDAIEAHEWKCVRTVNGIRIFADVADSKIVVNIAWVIILPLFYVRALSFVPENVKDMLSFLNQVKGVSLLYVMAVAIYLLPNLLTAALFIFPVLRHWIENSDWHIIRLLLWWSQPRVYVGRGMHESQFALIKYTLFWLILLCAKFAFSYFVHVILVVPFILPLKIESSVIDIYFNALRIFPSNKTTGAANKRHNEHSSC
ncbi:hypothetical protein J1N35_008321 [Gossypium stocksii]|uniref:Uncharacterized protein n=1 Tax=Gossypium stocksii TaxID=47602 RepID=A0A9D4AGD1_9ROSI|nr:hypothetical protein J1N35_008321 [Gossypium stocksii]